MTRTSHGPAREASSPPARTEEQEYASGRPGSTPVAVLATVMIAIASFVVVVLAFVVAAYQLA